MPIKFRSRFGALATALLAPLLLGALLPMRAGENFWRVASALASSWGKNIP